MGWGLGEDYGFRSRVVLKKTHTHRYIYLFFNPRCLIELGSCMQDLFDKKKDTRPCEGCGSILPLKMTKKMKVSTPSEQFLCRTCARVRMMPCSVCFLFSVCHLFSVITLGWKVLLQCSY